MTEKLENMCGDVLNNINVKENETMMNEREYIIAKAKEIGVTAEELGIEDYKADLIQFRNNCQFVSDQGICFSRLLGRPWYCRKEIQDC